MIREYIVTKDILNIRSKPSDESDFKGELKLNTTVWLDDKEIIGTIPTGGTTNIWLLYNTNKFVSKDGLGFSAQEYIDERFDGASFKEAIDYNFLLNIPQQIKQ